MNLYHIKYFIDAAKLNSISRSAEMNYISHSAVSQAIRSLESILGADLIIHSKRNFQLTEVGKASIKKLEKMLLNFDQIKSEIKNNDIDPIGDLSIWAPQSLLIDKLARAIVSYKQKYPKITLKINTGAAYLVKQNVMNQSCHLGVALDDQLMSHFQGETLDHGKFILVAKKKNADLENNEILTTQADKAEVLLLRNEYRKIFKHTLNLKTHVMSWGVIKEFVKNGYGIGYLPEYVIRREIEKHELHKIEFSGKLYSYKIKAIWHPEVELSRNAQLFLKELTLP